MRYHSTRGGAGGRTFADVLIEGLAPDGGLFVPDSYPRPDFAGETYSAHVSSVVGAFVGDDPLLSGLEEVCDAVYAGFDHPDVAPMEEVDGLHLLELIWGPTLSFKDYALQLVGALFDRVLAARDERLLILGATSGDTGSAAVEACRGRERLDIVILFPDGAVSDVQRRQMTTVADDNVHIVAVDGTFDDCQRLVKSAFRKFHAMGLGSINSINWGRIAAQAAYYWYAARKLPDADFFVPTGNFGNALSAHVARRMGAPIASVTVANNANHGLFQLIETGTLTVSSVRRTVAPAMDIQLPSNLERWLYEASGSDPAVVTRWQKELTENGSLTLPDPIHTQLRHDFRADWVDDHDALATIEAVYDSTGVVLDPHTAIAWRAAQKSAPTGPAVVVATAHPAKFGNMVREATGHDPRLPPSLDEVMSKPERHRRIDSRLDALEEVLVTASS